MYPLIVFFFIYLQPISVRRRRKVLQMIKVATLGLLSFKKVIHTCRISAATRTFGKLIGFLTVRYNFEEPPEHVNSYCKRESYIPSDKRGREYRDESSFSLRIKVRTYSTKLTFSVKNCSMLEGVLYVILFCFFTWKHFIITLN